MLKISDVILVHNERMQKYFIGLGVSEKHLVSLELFDYLYDGENSERHYEKSIAIAGNLDVVKSMYIRD